MECIIDMYTNQGLSSTKIAKEFNVSKYVILRRLKGNNIKTKSSKEYITGKTYEGIYGKQKAEGFKQKLSKSLKGKPVKNWVHKIKAGLNRYHENCRRNNIKIIRKGRPFSPERRLQRSIAQRNYIKEHPEELKRLREIQYPGNITKVEQKMLDFLRQNFKENADFYFDKQDMTGKTLYRPDFQFPKIMVIIEIDGYYKHFTTEGYKKDKIREYYLRKAGWNVYRFNFYDVDRQYKFEEVKNKIMDISRLNVNSWD